jgi:hypothetical protein
MLQWKKFHKNGKRAREITIVPTLWLLGSLLLIGATLGSHESTMKMLKILAKAILAASP